ncbi:MAG TPA: heme NO-binding domain-containing protein [Candidatus Obscuribacterales bacterium]
MYGLVNKAIQDMVCDRFGEETWEKIKQTAGVEMSSFLSMEGYPDDLTHRLVKAASEVLGLSASEIMQAFGEYWIQYTAQEGYGEMMEMSGDNLPDFLENLDNLHARVGVLFPQLQPPSFDCTDIEEESLNLHYHSSREGLAPMVIGLMKGLGTKFDTEVEITQTGDREQGADHDEFLIKYKPN